MFIKLRKNVYEVGQVGDAVKPIRPSIPICFKLINETTAEIKTSKYSFKVDATIGNGNHATFNTAWNYRLLRILSLHAEELGLDNMTNIVFKEPLLSKYQFATRPWGFFGFVPPHAVAIGPDKDLNLRMVIGR